MSNLRNIKGIIPATAPATAPVSALTPSPSPSPTPPPPSPKPVPKVAPSMVGYYQHARYNRQGGYHLIPMANGIHEVVQYRDDYQKRVACIENATPEALEVVRDLLRFL